MGPQSERSGRGDHSGGGWGSGAGTDPRRRARGGDDFRAPAHGGHPPDRPGDDNRCERRDNGRVQCMSHQAAGRVPMWGVRFLRPIVAAGGLQAEDMRPISRCGDADAAEQGLQGKRVQRSHRDDHTAGSPSRQAHPHRSRVRSRFRYRQSRVLRVNTISRMCAQLTKNAAHTALRQPGMTTAQGPRTAAPLDRAAEGGDSGSGLECSVSPPVDVRCGTRLVASCTYAKNDRFPTTFTRAETVSGNQIPRSGFIRSLWRDRAAAAGNLGLCRRYGGRHHEHKPRFLCRRGHMDRAIVCLGDFQSDVQPEAQTLLA